MCDSFCLEGPCTEASSTIVAKYELLISFTTLEGRESDMYKMYAFQRVRVFMSVSMFLLDTGYSNTVLFY